MSNIFRNACVSMATLGLGLSLVAAPAMAAGAERHGGSYQGADGIGIRNGNVIRGGGGGFGGGFGNPGGGRRDEGGFASGGRYDGGEYGYERRGYDGGYGYGYGAGALGLGLLGGAIIGQSYGYGYDPGYESSYDAGYDVVPQGGDSRGYCEARFKSYNPATGTYLGYDGFRHRCP